MSGWLMIIAKQTPEEREATLDNTAATLAKWEIHVDGIRWVEKLSQEGKATQLLQGGYPTRFVSNAREVVPLVMAAMLAQAEPMNFGEGHIMSGCWKSTVAVHNDRLSLCSPHQVITIDAWDLN